LIEAGWEKEIPRYSVLWLSEPDFSQHHYGPGSPEALAAIRNCDQRLASVLAELERRGVRDQTDVLVVSDHGFSTIAGNGDLASVLRAAGINARSSWSEPPRDGDVVTVGNGGSVLLYVNGHDNKQKVQDIVKLLQNRPGTGVIFTRSEIRGTFPLSDVMLDSPTSPDILVASTWKLSTGVDGHRRSEVLNDGYAEYEPGCGMHVTLSPSDLHNTLVAAGPDFQKGVSSTLASGNVDVVPTLLWLMGIKSTAGLDGRVLHEALVAGAATKPEPTHGHLTARAELKTGIWEQYLDFTEVNGVRYLDEGNGKFTPSRIQSGAKEVPGVSAGRVSAPAR
jgi:arylsulfatase A-like enzyme